MKIFKVTLAIALFGTLTVSAQEQGNGENSGAMDVAGLSQTRATVQTTPSIAGVASANKSFSTLVAALGAADLVSTLDGAGPFTVFAPTNDAFEKLPAGTVESLLKEENKGTLTSILTYHVVAGKFMAADVVKAIQDNTNSFTVETVQGNALTLSLKDGAVILTDANGSSSTVTATDVKASNGVIHVIDTVVMPK